jgi:two-component system invasion response regulator UvrY
LSVATLEIGMIDVFLVDDHEIVRQGITRLLNDVQGIRVVGEADSGEHAITRIRQATLPVDIVIMDIKMPGIGGLEATRRLVRMNTDLKVIVLSICSDELLSQRMLQAGASGYLTKGCHIDEMVSAIRKVHSGQRYLSPEIAQKLALRTMGEADHSPFALLSERELQIMIMITRGLRVTDISEKLCLSPKTINSYRYRLFQKLKIHNDVELTHLAIRYGMLEEMTSEHVE